MQQNAGRDAGLGKSADLSGFKEYIVGGYNRRVCRLYTLVDNQFQAVIVLDVYKRQGDMLDQGTAFKRR